MADTIYIHGASRTPIGSLGGSLATVSAPVLGSVAIKGAAAAAGVNVSDVDLCLMGNVLTAGIGQAPARQAALAAGIPESTPCVTVGKVCGSGMQAVIDASRQILLGESTTVVAGGMENMSQAPHLLPAMRQGVKLGHSEVKDSMVHDGLWDPYNDQHMGNCGEACAATYHFTREEQDAYAADSYCRAQKAQVNGLFANEISKVEIKTRKGTIVVMDDEGPAQVNFDKIPTLRSVFQKDGTITAANASSINDGAAALVLSGSDEGSLARIASWGGHARTPVEFPSAPVSAIKQALDRADWSVDDVDLWEVNEAFAVVPMCVIHDLGVSPDKLNVNGGAISLGHPIGASGARIIVTLLHEMIRRDVKKGVAAICIGGGEGLAVCIER